MEVAMSIIIGIKDKEGVYLACDTQSSNDIKHIYTGASDSKIVVLNHEPLVLLGHAGYSKGSNIYQLLSKKIQSQNIDELTYEWVVKVLITNIIQLEQNHRMIRDDEYPKHPDGQFIIAMKHRLFIIDGDRGSKTKEINEFGVIGSTESFAYGMLRAHKSTNPKSALINTLIECRNVDSFVEGPFLLYHTQATDYEIIDVNPILTVEPFSKRGDDSGSINRNKT